MDKKDVSTIFAISVNSRSTDNIEVNQQTIRARLDVRCKGLLEVLRYGDAFNGREFYSNYYHHYLIGVTLLDCLEVELTKDVTYSDMLHKLKYIISDPPKPVIIKFQIPNSS
jgi:hypothetical protein